jgi:hypothetical protein
MGYIRVIYGTYMGYIKPKDERKANIGDKEGKLEAIGTWGNGGWKRFLRSEIVAVCF